MTVRRLLTAAVCLGLMAAPLAAQSPVKAVADPEALFKDKDPIKNKNKQAALHIMRELLQCGHWSDAGNWLTASYIQHQSQRRRRPCAGAEIPRQHAAHRHLRQADNAGRGRAGRGRPGQRGDRAQLSGSQQAGQDLHDQLVLTCGASSTARPTSIGTRDINARPPQTQPP